MTAIHPAITLDSSALPIDILKAAECVTTIDQRTQDFAWMTLGQAIYDEYQNYHEMHEKFTLYNESTNQLLTRPANLPMLRITFDNFGSGSTNFLAKLFQTTICAPGSFDPTSENWRKNRNRLIDIFARFAMESIYASDFMRVPAKDPNRLFCIIHQSKAMAESCKRAWVKFDNDTDKNTQKIQVAISDILLNQNLVPVVPLISLIASYALEINFASCFPVLPFQQRVMRELVITPAEVTEAVIKQKDDLPQGDTKEADAKMVCSNRETISSTVHAFFQYYFLNLIYQETFGVKTCRQPLTSDVETSIVFQIGNKKLNEGRNEIQINLFPNWPYLKSSWFIVIAQSGKYFVSDAIGSRSIILHMINTSDNQRINVEPIAIPAEPATATAAATS